MGTITRRCPAITDENHRFFVKSGQSFVDDSIAAHIIATHPEKHKKSEDKYEQSQKKT